MQPQSQDIRIAYLGPPMDHHDVLAKALASAGLSLTVLPDYATWLRETARRPAGGIKGRILRIASQFVGTQDRAYVEEMTRRLDADGVTDVIAYWGTVPLADVMALKRARRRIRFFINILCHPLGLAAKRIRMQNLLFRNAASSLDGLIVPSSAMGDYAKKHLVGRRRDMPMLLLPPCWTSDYQPPEPAPEPKPEPNIIFLGRMDRNHAQPSDDVYDFLLALMQEGVNVHFGRSRDGDIQHPHALAFEPVPLIEVSRFANQFDASLVVYNMGAVERPDRFDNTVPDRLIASVAIGIPIAVPRQGFAGCKEYLKGYAGVLEYDSPADLAAQMRDRGRMAELRRLAQANFRSYNAESNIPALLSFLGRVSGQKMVS